jgi:glycerophosphoryl diester phosphodiesterase
MKARTLFLLLVALVAAGCSQDAEVVVPDDNSEFFMAETRPVSARARAALEGVYRVVAGGAVFGQTAVLKWSGSPQGSDTTFTLSIFGERDVSYCILQAGTLDSVFFFTGYWRKMVNTETGIAHLTILGGNGGKLLFSPSPVVGKDSIVITGGWGNEGESPAQPMRLVYERPLYRGVALDIIAHRGGGRTSDLLPVSENSVEMILFTERLGSTGVEIDVALTKDGVPILYHDTNVNLRLTRKSGLVGPIDQYTYAQVQTFVRLIHGERVPTLREALDAVLYRTSLRVVWLDNKPTASLSVLQEIQKEYLARAASAGRTLEIYIGLPSQDKVDEFLRLPDYANTPSLCELGVDKAREVNARVWAPRWTEGTQNDLVAQMQAEGRKAYVWTLDQPSYIQEFLANGRFNGILSNYVPSVAYYHYVRQ